MSKKADIKYLGIPNICFSLTEKDDDREKKYSKQRKKRGFDDSETWSLCDTIANFIIPRLERYIEIASQVNVETEEYNKSVNDFLEAMKLIERDDGIWIFTEKEQEQLESGLKAFQNIFMGLWW